jgi:hypothetical protein
MPLATILQPEPQLVSSLAEQNPLFLISHHLPLLTPRPCFSSWSHPLQNKAQCSLSPTTFLCQPLDLALAAGLIPCKTKPHCLLSPASSLCPSLALAFS